MSINRSDGNRSRGAWSPFLLLRRTYATLGGDWLNVALLVFQPILIAILISVVAVGDASIPKKLFLGSVSALWLGCSNAAQIIVKERAIFLRERLAGLRIHSYLGSKFVAMGLITCAQVTAMYFILYFTGAGLVGSVTLQLLAMISGALALTGIGILVSALSQDITKAILAVPIIIIPQILLSGYIFTIDTWHGRPLISLINRISPSYCSQKIIDASFFWDRKVDWDFLNQYELGTVGYLNLQAASAPTRVWLLGETKKYFITGADRDEYLSHLKETNQVEFAFGNWAAYLAYLKAQVRRSEASGSNSPIYGPVEAEEKLREWAIEKSTAFSISAAEKAEYYRAPPPPNLKDENFVWPFSFPKLTEGIYHHKQALTGPLLILAGWVAVSYMGAWIFLSRAR